MCVGLKAHTYIYIYTYYFCICTNAHNHRPKTGIYLDPQGIVGVIRIGQKGFHSSWMRVRFSKKGPVAGKLHNQCPRHKSSAMLELSVYINICTCVRTRTYFANMACTCMYVYAYDIFVLCIHHLLSPRIMYSYMFQSYFNLRTVSPGYSRQPTPEVPNPEAEEIAFTCDCVLPPSKLAAK